MISSSYVKCESSTTYKDFRNFFESTFGELDEMLSNIKRNENLLMTESSILGLESGDLVEEMEFLESQKESFVSKVGKGILDTIKKVIDMVKTFVDKLRLMTIDSNKDIKKIEMLIKRNPEAKKEADKIFSAMEKGLIDMSDIKTLSDLNKNCDEIIKLSLKANTDPKSLKGKFMKFKEKAENIDKSTAGKAIVGTAAVVGAFVVIRTASSKMKKADAEFQKYAREMNENHNDLYAQLRKDKIITTDMGRHEANYLIAKQSVDISARVVQKSQSKIVKLALYIRKAADHLEKKFNPEAIKDFHDISYEPARRKAAEDTQKVRDIISKKAGEASAIMRQTK